ncbi:type II toxin-antitoxin system VapC family toxin [Nocardiopsis composta]|uniref:Putative nucleic acid-binding protein n=1 Tax=Nocardiopsis composta TaxID=157465 RepID=A0A7W8QTM4_9ACTN|nr:type II toxin-antitoxin system VapC family toxin [Nocardiopsis composta]MBB5435750.1 putative nucleic acid-binding protein [Nocardiopsis composta]
MIVTDASALANMLIYREGRGRKARAALGRDVHWAAPEHWKAEVFSAIRGLYLGRKTDESTARQAVERIPRLGVETVPLEALLPRMWRLRSSVSAYDAAYVALAESRAAELVTADARLARVAVSYCRVDLVG